MKNLTLPIICPNNICTDVVIYTSKKTTDVVLYTTKGILTKKGTGISSITNIVARYPIPLDILKKRILLLYLQEYIWLQQTLQVHSNTVLIFDLDTDLKLCIKTLKGTGGVYLLWSKTTGMFYIGSTIRFVTQGYKHGRLSYYFSFKDINKPTPRYLVKQVSRDLANLLVKYTINDFVVIILFSMSITNENNTTMKTTVQKLEQFWMLLKPTLNRSLLAISGIDNQVTPESLRLTSPTLKVFFQYEVVNGFIVNKTIIKGLKMLSLKGVTDMNGNNHPAEYYLLRHSLDTLTIWKDKFLFSYQDYPIGSVIDMKHEVKRVGFGEVWVYNAETLKFISLETNSKNCQSKYNISSTHLSRVRRFGKVYNGNTFSNKKLH